MNAPSASDAAGPAPLARGPVMAAALAVLLLHLAAANGYGIFRDEFYYLDCAQHLDWGYVDQPPLSIVLLAGIKALFGQSALALRAPAALLAGLAIVLGALTAREIGGRAWAQGMAALAIAIAPTIRGISGFYSMNAIDLAVWSAGALLFARILRTGEARLWLPFGILCGLGLQNKFSVAFLGFGVAVALACTPHRRHYLRPQLYLGGAIAALLYLPNIVWQFQHDFAMFEFMRNAALHKNAPLPPHRYLLGQIVEFHPLNAAVWIAGIAFAFRRPEGRPWRGLAIVFLAVFALLAATNGKVYYLAGAYFFALPLGALALERFTAARPRWRAAVPILMIAGGLLTAPMAIAILPIASYLRYQARIGLAPQPGERGHAEAGMPQHFADRFGWPELAVFVARHYDALEPADRAQCAILTRDYGQASSLNYFGPALGLPRALCGHNNHWLWGPGAATGEVVLYLGRDTPEQLAQYYGSVVEVGRFSHPYAMPYLRDHPLYLCRGSKMPLSAAWAALRHYI